MFWKGRTELKHSGSTTSFAPAFAASRTFERALERLRDLSAPAASCTRPSLRDCFRRDDIVAIADVRGFGEL